jgi:hypothetical protein
MSKVNNKSVKSSGSLSKQTTMEETKMKKPMPVGDRRVSISTTPPITSKVSVIKESEVVKKRGIILV